VGACYRSLVDHAPESMLISLYDRNAGRVPKRLRGYSSAEMVGAFQKVAAGLAPSPAPFANGAA
jgi:hypothetical protein